MRIIQFKKISEFHSAQRQNFLFMGLQNNPKIIKNLKK